MKIDAKWIKDHTNNMEVHFVAISKLVFRIKPSRWPDLKHMERMMFGFNRPVLIDEKCRIIAGQLSVSAALDLGMSDAPCIIVCGLSEEQRHACCTADLYPSYYGYSEDEGKWDEEMLRKVLETHAADSACDDMARPYAEARKKLLVWLHGLDMDARLQALKRIRGNNGWNWNGIALVHGLEAVLAVIDYRNSIDNLYFEKSDADSDYEEKYGEKDEDDPWDRPVTPEEDAAELEIEKAADAAGELLSKLGAGNWEPFINEGFFGDSYNDAKKKLDSVCWKWNR